MSGRTSFGAWLRGLVVVAGLAGVALAASAQQDASPADSNELARQATDPTASLMSLGFITTYTGDFYGERPGEPDHAWEFKFQPVIPFTLLEMPNILRISLPYQIDGPGDNGVKDISIFNLTVVNQSWGRWGLGPVMTFATGDDPPDRFAIGPALGFVYQVDKRLNVGLFSQNVFWEHTAVSQLQPIVAYQLGDGWSLSLGDLQVVYDWKASRWLNAPIGVQLGKIVRIAGQAVRVAVNPQYNLIDDKGLEQWKVSVSVTLLLPSK